MTKILLVDDEPDLIKILEITFQSAKFETVSAFNGKSAIEAASKEGISLVVLDFYLPDMNGDEVFSAIRQKKPSLPVIFISASQEKLQELPNAEKTEKMVKPIAFDKLLELVKKYV